MKDLALIPDRLPASYDELIDSLDVRVVLRVDDNDYLTRTTAADMLRQPISADSVLQLTSREVTEASITARLAEVSA